jgi:SnoaL-like domain
MADPGVASLAERIERIEAQLAIQQLAVRYAMAVDARDIDAWTGCFVPDVDMGRHGRGREALRRYIDPMVRRFYRSVHQICGHRVELIDPDRATGAVYCRAEHEVGEQWVVMAICYFDEYARVDGEWFFSRRRERHWYAADVTSTPQSAGFAGWSGSGQPALPAEFPSWTRFWDSDARVGTLTATPAAKTAKTAKTAKIAKDGAAR